MVFSLSSSFQYGKPLSVSPQLFWLLCYSFCTTRKLASTPSLSLTQDDSRWSWRLTPHQLIAFTEVSELPITLWKGIYYCTQYFIGKALSFSHLSPTYFSFTITLSSMLFQNIIVCSVASLMKKCYEWRDDYFTC